MSTDKDALSNLLFGDDGSRRLLNFKLLRGDKPNVTEQELRDEARSALVQVRLQTCDTFEQFPESTKAKPVDVTKLKEQLTA